MFEAFRKVFIAPEIGLVTYASLEEAERQGIGEVARLPFSLKIIVENMLRNADSYGFTPDDLRKFFDPLHAHGSEFPLMPARVLLQDFTGVPALVDLAAMREAVRERGGDESQVNPVIPVDLVIDHSVQVDVAGNPQAIEHNMRREFERNSERYAFLKWASRAFQNLRIIPPGAGIVHQVNLEYLARGVFYDEKTGTAYPDTLVGTDSHTTMINGLGVLGWGVGGIEAEAAMLGQPLNLVRPKVVGVRLENTLQPGVTATDLVLFLTQLLRTYGVVDKFVEFYGEGVCTLSLPDRATIANMAPEYGATVGFFPIDAVTLEYLRQTGRAAQSVDLVERYAKTQGMFVTAETPEATYDERLACDLSQVESSIAGPKRPQDRLALGQVKQAFYDILRKPTSEQGYGVPENDTQPAIASGLTHGSIVIAAITSCTNTSNPSLMVAAGLLAQKASEHGLRVRPYVKTSLAPGSRVVTRYLEASGLLRSLEALGFGVVGFGCTTCIGNSGPLAPEIESDIKNHALVTASVLSGNRNFEGRVHPLVKANFLASPPLVVAYALAGKIDIDFATEPLGFDTSGVPVFLRDLWPAQEEVAQTLEKSLDPKFFTSEYGKIGEGTSHWQEIETPESVIFQWDASSTYIRKPPFFETPDGEVENGNIFNARVLVSVGDSVSTDHISPAGDISQDSEAARYLQGLGVPTHDFNSYGARRGNHEVMVRGTFSNVRLKNKLARGKEGGWTSHLPSGDIVSIYDASLRYQQEKIPLIILAGKDYGMGSSRDWAAKGVALLGVRAVIFESIERIHRSNLIGMNLLPLQFMAGETAQVLGITGEEMFDIFVPQVLTPRMKLKVRAHRTDGSMVEFIVLSRLDTPLEIEYFENDGILPSVMKSISNVTTLQSA